MTPKLETARVSLSKSQLRDFRGKTRWSGSRGRSGRLLIQIQVCLTSSLVTNQGRRLLLATHLGGLMSNPYYYYRNYSILLVLIKIVLKPTQKNLIKRFHASDQEPGGEPASRKSNPCRGSSNAQSSALLETQYTALQRVAMDINTRNLTSQ